MKKVAFVTYNFFGGLYLKDGWNRGSGGRKALVIRKTKGFSGPSGDAAALADHRRDQIHQIWAKLEESLPELDHIVVYVGSNGSENAIRLAAQLPASKVTFVSCRCNLDAKKWLARSAGLDGVEWIECECRGAYTMTDLYDNFMKTGEFRPDKNWRHNSGSWF